MGTELRRLVLCMDVLVCGNPARSHLLMCKNFPDYILRQITQGQGLLPSLYLSVWLKTSDDIFFFQSGLSSRPWSNISPPPQKAWVPRMNYSQLSIILQMRKLRAREGAGLSKGEWDILPGTLALGFLISFLPSMVINWQVLTLRINYLWKCKRLF